MPGHFLCLSIWKTEGNSFLFIYFSRFCLLLLFPGTHHRKESAGAVLLPVRGANSFNSCPEEEIAIKKVQVEGWKCEGSSEPILLQPGLLSDWIHIY